MLLRRFIVIIILDSINRLVRIAVFANYCQQFLSKLPTSISSKPSLSYIHIALWYSTTTSGKMVSHKVECIVLRHASLLSTQWTMEQNMLVFFHSRVLPPLPPLPHLGTKTGARILSCKCSLRYLRERSGD